MQIRVNLQIFLFILIFILTRQIEIYAWIMLFAFIHELGHMIAGLILKLKPKALSFMPFGISITFETYEYKKLIEIKKILIALAGPVTNILIILIALVLLIDTQIKQTIIYSNMLIATFNLIPMYPLDGGRILKGIMRLTKSKEKADEITNKISNIIMILFTFVASILILIVKNFGVLFLLAYLWMIIIRENKKYRLRRMMYKKIQMY